MEILKDIIKPLYNSCFSVDKTRDPVTIMGELLKDDFQSINAGETKSKAQLIGQVQYLWKLIPDLKFDIQEILQDGKRIIVRCIVTGTPNGEFMGLNLDGSKSFRIMSIDIHTFEGEKVKAVHHLEEWTTAIKQLRGIAA